MAEFVFDNYSNNRDIVIRYPKNGYRKAKKIAEEIINRANIILLPSTLDEAGKYVWDVVYGPENKGLI